MFKETYALTATTFIFYWDGSTWIDGPRVVTGLNTADTHIVFKSQVNIPANGSKTAHYIMYGNPSAGPPATLTYTNVYLWYDDFSTNPFSGSPLYTLAKAVDIHGNGYSVPTHDAVNQRVNFDTGDNVTSDMYVDNAGFSNGEQDVLIAVDHDADLNYPANATDAIIARVSAINTTSTHEYLHYSHGNYPNSPAIAWDTWVNAERNTLGGALSGPSRVYWPFNSPRTWAFAVFGTTARFWEDGDLDAEPWFTAEVPLLSGSTTAPQSGYMGVAAAQSRGWWDNLIIRRYTEPEPALSFAAEEALFANMIIGKAVNPSGTQPPGTDLTYTITITSTGNSPAVSVVVTDTLAAEVDFQVGSVVNTLPPGIGVTVEYWDGTTWAYVPVSAGCSAPAGYDRCVQYIRWTLLNDLGAVPPDNTGTLEFISRIR